MKRKLLLLANLVFPGISHGNDEKSGDVNNQTSSTDKIERMEIRGQRIRNFVKGLKDDDVSKTEVLDGHNLRRYGAQTLADAIKQARGVDTQLFCANCGAKRISINGLRGEHTTILIDDFPLHSTVSSFYGIDAVPIIGIENIGVNRGAGSSLISPESIGGSINLLTASPQASRFKFTGEIGSEGSRQSSVLASHIAGSTSLQVMGFTGFSRHWDLDNNGIAESPERSNQAVTLLGEEQLSSDATLKIRYSEADLEIIGGNTQGYKPQNYSSVQAVPEDFINNDVREIYTGILDPITEVIDLKRQELAVSLDHYLSDDSLLKLRLSSTQQHQNGFYSHAFDYDNKDDIQFAGLSYQMLLGAEHLLTFGLESKDQAMNSDSQALFVDRDPPLDRDSFRYKSRSFYLMDEWQSRHDLTISFALRGDQINVDWIEMDKDLDGFVLAPRFLSLWEIDLHISSRLTLGLGYRPPLTLFESQHGSSHDGFIVEIDELEKAYSGVYAFSLNYPDWFSTWSVHYTHLMNMPYAVDRISTREPLLFVNADESFDIVVFDWFFGGKTFEHGEWQLGIERYLYPDSYAEKLPTAAIDFRVQADYIQPLSFGLSTLQLVYVGPRDLSRFGYDNHYNVYNIDITSPNFGNVSEQKTTKVPGYILLNLSYEAPLSEVYTAKFRVYNLGDFTQAKIGDTPATWHWHETHAHFDNFHTWGPNRGREYFFELSATL